MATNACNDCGCSLHECECFDDPERLKPMTFAVWLDRWLAREKFEAFMEHRAADTAVPSDVLHAMYDDRVTSAQENIEALRKEAAHG